MTQEFKDVKWSLGGISRRMIKTNQYLGFVADVDTMENATLIKEAPEMLERLKEQNIDLKILKENLIEASKSNARFEGYPDQVQKWIDANNELITKATAI